METEETNNNNNNDNIIDNNNEITQEKKKKNKVRPFFNVRAHSNPLADKPFENTPVRPKDFDWSTLYPEFYEYQHKTNQKLSKVEMADVGCGFGGLLGSFFPFFVHFNSFFLIFFIFFSLLKWHYHRSTPKV